MASTLSGVTLVWVGEKRHVVWKGIRRRAPPVCEVCCCVLLFLLLCYLLLCCALLCDTGDDGIWQDGSTKAAQAQGLWGSMGDSCLSGCTLVGVRGSNPQQPWWICPAREGSVNSDFEVLALMWVLQRRSHLAGCWTPCSVEPQHIPAYTITACETASPKERQYHSVNELLHVYVGRIMRGDIVDPIVDQL
jgi:hypothetical protein